MRSGIFSTLIFLWIGFFDNSCTNCTRRGIAFALAEQAPQDPVASTEEAQKQEEANPNGVQQQQQEQQQQPPGVVMTYINELPHPVYLYFESPVDGSRIIQNEGEPISAYGGEAVLQTFPGHTFSYDYAGHRHFEVVPSPYELETDVNDKGEYLITSVLLAGHTEINVNCHVTASSRNLSRQSLVMRIIPWWSPVGASHFLDLVRRKYYDGVALNRVVPGFLTQFGISPNPDLREFYEMKRIRDDHPHIPIPFRHGMISYAGNGKNSRTTEIFIVDSQASQPQLDYFGQNPWETPFGVVDGVEESSHVMNKWYAYGDMPPQGNGPDSKKIYEEDGYEYLDREFPLLDYIQECAVEEILDVPNEFKQEL